MIVASAIKLKNGSIFVGKRHGDVFSNIMTIYQKMGMDYEDARKKHFGATQGFINDRMQFLNREEAYYEAFSCRQCKEQIRPSEKRIEQINKMFTDSNPEYKWKPQLASEDIW
jgi:hypothetical protein